MTKGKATLWLIIGSILVLLIVSILFYAYLVPPGSRFDYESAYTKQNKTKFIELDDIKLHYLEKGQGDPLILIHGGGAWLYTFRNNINELSKQFTVYAVDMPGHGYTEYAEGVKMDLNYTAGILKSFMEKKGITKASFVGNSWGGGWVLDFVQKYPEKAEKLVLIDASGLKDSVKRDQSIWPSMRYPVLGELIAHFFTYNNVKDGYVFTDKSKLDESVYQEFYKPLSLSHNLRSQYLYQRGLNWSETDARLNTMTTPTMILWGRQDTIYEVSMAEEYARRIPNSTVHIIEEAGHLPHEEQPEQVNRLLIDFLV